jgi:HSP20 family protein
VALFNAVFDTTFCCSRRTWSNFASRLARSQEPAMPEKTTGETSPSRENPPSRAGQGTATEQKQTDQPAQTGGREKGSRRTEAMQGRSAQFLPGPFGIAPMALVRRLLEDVDRMFEEVGGRAMSQGGMQGGGLASAWSPAIELLERDGRLLVRAELPGLSPDDVTIEAEGNSLVIRGERRSELEVEENGVYRTERSYGRFTRAIELPEGADLSKAQARFENGLLEISVPLSEQGNRRRIEIQRSPGETRDSSIH